MEYISWNDSLSVKADSIDLQHKKLVELLNQLFDAMKSGKGKDVVEKIIDELANYTIEHFTHEEGMMKKAGFPDFTEHKAQHDDFVKKVKEFRNDFGNGKILLSIDILKFLGDWVINHIMGSDQKYVPYFQDKGLK